MTLQLRDQRCGDQCDGKDHQGLYTTDHVQSRGGHPLKNLTSDQYSTTSSSLTVDPNKLNDNNNYIDDIEVRKWSSMIGRDWDLLWIFLNLTKQQMYQLEQMYPRNILKRIFITLKRWSDVVVQCGEDPRMLLAAAFVQGFNHYNTAHNIVPKDKLDINLKAKPHTIECIKRIEFYEEDHCHCCKTHKEGHGAVNIFPGGIYQASAPSE